jgi:hypothetical protein
LNSSAHPAFKAEFWLGDRAQPDGVVLGAHAPAEALAEANRLLTLY